MANATLTTVGYEVPVFGGPFDGSTIHVRELPFSFDAPMAAVTGIKSHIHYLRWLPVPMGEMLWLYAVFVHETRRSLQGFAPGNTYVRRVTLPTPLKLLYGMRG